MQHGAVGTCGSVLPAQQPEGQLGLCMRGEGVLIQIGSWYLSAGLGSASCKPIPAAMRSPSELPCSF